MVNVADQTLSLDVSTEFRGIGFTDTEPTENYSAKLHLLTKKEGVWKVPASSKLQVASNQIENFENGQYSGKALTQAFTTNNLTVNTQADIPDLHTEAITGNASGQLNVVSGTKVQILNNTAATSSGAALVVTGGIKASSLRVSGETNLIGFGSSSNTLSVQGPVSVVETSSGAANGNLTVGNTLKTTDLDVANEADIKALNVGTKANNAYPCTIDASGNITTSGTLEVTGNSVELPTTTKANLSGKPTAVNACYVVEIDKDGLLKSESLKRDFYSGGTTKNTLKVPTLIQQGDNGKLTNITFEDIPTASTKLGLVKLVSDTKQPTAANDVSATANRTYAIQKNPSDQLVVNVPWEDSYGVKVDGATPNTLYPIGLQSVASGKKDTVYMHSNFKYEGNVLCVPSLKLTNSSGINIQADNGTDVNIKGKWKVTDNAVYNMVSNTYFGSGTTYTITNGGACTMASYNAVSDQRLKENIQDYTPKGSILDLPVKEFDFKRDGSHHIGCLAQDLQKICPEIVHEGEDGYLSIEENKIVYLLLEEVKKLKKQVEQLEKEQQTK